MSTTGNLRLVLSLFQHFIEQVRDLTGSVYSRNQQNDAANVRFGSKADIASRPRHVRYSPQSGHSSARFACPLSASSGSHDTNCCLSDRSFYEHDRDPDDVLG